MQVIIEAKNKKDWFYCAKILQRGINSEEIPTIPDKLDEKGLLFRACEKSGVDLANTVINFENDNIININCKTQNNAEKFDKFVQIIKHGIIIHEGLLRYIKMLIIKY